MKSEEGRERQPPEPAVEQPLEELLMGAAKALRRRWSAGLGQVAGLDLSPHDARALRVIRHHGPTRLGVVADHLRIAPRSATDVVDRLEGRGLVERGIDPDDRRAVTVTLTAAGEQVMARVAEQRRAEGADFFDALTPAERHTLALLLTRLDAPSVGP